MARAQQGAGIGSLPVPGLGQIAAPNPNLEYLSCYPLCFRRSQLLCGHHDNSCGHRGEGGRLQHLPLPQRGLVEASAVLQARVPGQAGSVAAPGQQPAHGDGGDGDDDEGTASMLPPCPTSCQLQQGPQQALRGCHRSRDGYLRGRMSPCPLQLLSRHALSVPGVQVSALLWEPPVLSRDALLGAGQDSRKTAHARSWPGHASKAPMDSLLSLSTVWIVGFFTVIYLKVFCYCDFFLFFFKVSS